MQSGWESFGVTTGVLVGVGVVASLTLAVVVVAVVGGMRRALRFTPWVLLAMTTVAILVATLGFSVGDPDASAGINLHPLTEIRRGLRAGASEAVAANVWGNITMFVPLGLLLMWLWTSPLIARVLMATIAGAGLSVIIELTQLSLHRVADIDDVILNGAGALLGALVGMVTVLLWRLGRWLVRLVRGRGNPAAAAS
ncbi:VanZ family protein [Demequina sp.]|uniref:VanZ family protein n=1 Tax=Demequina sp. TaxID=2050685 RepID=UPI0025BD3C2D|nr:VanZ family protein [Demequina sp.]